MSRASDDELADVLDELAGLLDRLEGDIPADRRPRADRSRRSRGDRVNQADQADRVDRANRTDRERPSRPRPPSPGEFVRFTEQYTIPTLISLLEATIAALELLRAVLRLTGGRGLPDPRPGRSRDPISETGRRAVEGLDDVLADLNDALSGQPTDPEARDLLTEARDLRAEIEGLLDDEHGRRNSRSRSAGDGGGREGSADRGGRNRRTSGVRIAVDDGTETNDAETAADGDDADDDGDEPGSTVDVEAELDALKRARDEKTDPDR